MRGLNSCREMLIRTASREIGTDMAQNMVCNDGRGDDVPCVNRLELRFRGCRKEICGRKCEGGRRL